MAITIGLNGCGDCGQTASHKLLPCGHTTCSKHYKEPADGDAVTCGICREEIHAIAEVKSARATDPIHHKDDKWSVDKTHHLFSSLGALNQGRDSKANLPLRNIDATSPTPAPGRITKKNTGGNNTMEGDGNQPTRYVPPPLRNTQAPNVRPESSISNATFASQPSMTPMPQMPSMPPMPVASNRGPYGNTSLGGFTLPRGNYRFGPGQLNERFASLDPFVDAPRPPTYRNGNNNAAYSTGRGFGYPTASKHPLAQAMNAVDMVTIPSIQNSPHDSAAANGSGADMSRAARLAALIRSGATDDPADIDYGNPCPSRRLPPEPYNTHPTAPVPRGKVAEGYSNALVSYNDAESNTKGNAAAFLGVNDIALPPWFPQADHCYTPSVEEVFEVLPMIEGCCVAKPTTAGVIKITNIPYASSRAEIVAFLGRNAQILSQPEGSPYHAVHIMMDRHTAKTNDVFVEVKTPKEAVFIVSQFDKRLKAGRSAKIGDREVTVTVVSQAEFMAELFPRAKNVEWYGPVPKVSDKREYYYPGVPSSGFQGFLQDEELRFMAKHAENPQRSPFASRVPCRNYESLITLLHKYPWHAVKHVLLQERHAIFIVTLKCIRALMGFLRETSKNRALDRTLPTAATLQEIAVAALTCPGFSEGHKGTIVLNLGEAGFQHMTTARGMNFRFGGNHKFATEWPFHALIKQPGVHEWMVEYVASLFRDATMGNQNVSLADLHSMRASGTTPAKFGEIRVDYKNVNNLADLGRAELRAIEETLSRILPRSGPRSLGSHTASQLS